MNRNSVGYQFSTLGREEAAEIDATGKALADAAHERGERLGDMERAALTRNSMYGSDSYPIAKRGRGWVVDHDAARGAGIFKTRHAAVRQWEILVAKWVHMSGLEAYARQIMSMHDGGDGEREVSHA